MSFGDRTRQQLPKKLAGKRARISSYLINSYSLNTATDTIQYTLRRPFISQSFPGWLSWTILRMMLSDNQIQCILVNLNLREFKIFYTVETVVNNWIPLVRRIYLQIRQTPQKKNEQIFWKNTKAFYMWTIQNDFLKQITCLVRGKKSQKIHTQASCIYLQNKQEERKALLLSVLR